MCPPLASALRLPKHGAPGLVCHCLLIETEAGLVLVDTGLGLEDVRDPTRLAPGFAKVAGAVLDERETAIRQVEKLGFRASDVRHVLPTHLDLDHAGGLPDFPKAKVHLFRPEKETAVAPPTWAEKQRYRPAHFAHGPDWELYDTSGEAWNGFACVRALRGLPPEILIVPLVGHTRGHAAIAVDLGKRWLVHAGDAYFAYTEMDREAPSCPWPLAAFQTAAAVDNDARKRNAERLRVAARDHDLDVICAHDRWDLDRKLVS